MNPVPVGPALVIPRRWRRVARDLGKQIVDPPRRRVQVVEVEAQVAVAPVERPRLCCGGEADFPPYTATLRTKHKPKRNLRKLLDGKRW